MKLTKFAALLVIGVALNFAVVGCKHHPTPLTPIPGSTTGGTGEPGAGGTIEGGGAGTGGGVAPTPAANPAEWASAGRNESIFADDMVHFAYDSSVVRSSEKAKVAKVADHLKANPGTGLEIEGHCDERGTDQYNYALGERRALALREELIALGVDGSRVLTKSFGRSRPIDTGHSEAAHARNRRGAFILLTK
jgi:outer membrane protein OmpA-like peptidoglycan-associated protein